MIRFRCQDCKRKIGIDDSKAGKLVLCPNCQARVRIPMRSTVPESSRKTNPASANIPTAPPIPLATPVEKSDNGVNPLVAHLPLPSQANDSAVEDFELDPFSPSAEQEQMAAAEVAEELFVDTVDVIEEDVLGDDLFDDVPVAEVPENDDLADLAAVDDLEDDDDFVDVAEERPHPARGKRRPGRDEEDAEDEESNFLTANRIRGIVAIVLGVGMLVYLLVVPVAELPIAEQFHEKAEIGGFGLAGAFIAAGLFYLIMG